MENLTPNDKEVREENFFLLIYKQFSSFAKINTKVHTILENCSKLKGILKKKTEKFQKNINEMKILCLMLHFEYN